MKNTSDFTFLTDGQIFGDDDGNNQLEILKKYGTKCSITDFSILLGGYVLDWVHTSGGNTRKIRTGWWWTKSPYNDDARVVSYNGDIDWHGITTRYGGARPAIRYSSIKSVCSNEVINDYGIKEIEYGEYPQTIVDENYSCELEIESAYNNGNLRATGKTYTTDSVRHLYFDSDFKAITHTEYEYNESKYIRFVGDSNCEGGVLSDGREVKSGKVYWVKVEPITWLVDEKADIALSREILFSGVQFDNYEEYTGDFDKTDIKQFMDNYFSKEIVADRVYSQDTSIEQDQNMDYDGLYSEDVLAEQDYDIEGKGKLRKKNQDQHIKNKKKIQKKNPYNFDFNGVSEEDIIRGAVESNISVFLHGRSSDGKSARVKQLDPDCEIIYMRNATPDSLNGKSVYNSSTGEMIDVPPTWYSRVLEKCEKEPDKIHIIFFDELTNALPSIQGMAFNIVLDGEVNGKWKLPPNARIVAAGNDLDDSLAANEMAEPLFNRFAHVYINTTTNDWLKWASTPNEKYERLDYKEEKTEAKIHPSIYAYIASHKSYSKHNVLRTPYTGDKPNADPRKWEMASKLLYKTKKPEMLRALVGEDITKDFIAFARQQVISVEDVVNHNYSDEDLKMDVSEKYATAIGLLSANEEQIGIVRDFMKQLGEEPRATFESLWACGDEKRLEKLAELQMADSLSQGGIRK